MRTLRTAAAVSAAAALVLAGCSGSTTSTSDSSAPAADSGVVTLTVGASPSPHAKILQYIDDNLAADAGIDIEIVEYSDYILPNTALNDGDLDANFYQTVPYLEQQERENGYDFEPGTGVHLEPLAVYSSKIKDLTDLPAGATVGIINDVTNQSRALKLLADQGLVKLPTDGSDANVNNVTALKDFTFQEVEGPQLVRALNDVDVAVINGNYAQEGGLTQANDAIVVESPENNPAVNVLVWKAGANKAGAIAELEKLLHSDEVKQFIKQTWADGSVIPAF